jgi:MSHA biogenesis protein MshJ
MAALARSLVAPAEMTALLEGLLRRQPGVRLVSLRSIAAEQVKANANAEHPLALFRHGVEVELEGGWSDLHGYLKAIEQSPKHLLWGQLDLKVRKYPRAVLKLTLYTLGTESSWLQL